MTAVDAVEGVVIGAGEARFGSEVLQSAPCLGHLACLSRTHRLPSCLNIVELQIYLRFVEI
jgi:hypothetical protein